MGYCPVFPARRKRRMVSHPPFLLVSSLSLLLVRILVQKVRFISHSIYLRVHIPVRIIGRPVAVYLDGDWLAPHISIRRLDLRQDIYSCPDRLAGLKVAHFRHHSFPARTAYGAKPILILILYQNGIEKNILLNRRLK